jgi:DNA-directed RNA polymerase subunit M/transcription elongation factor TFIIS
MEELRKMVVQLLIKIFNKYTKKDALVYAKSFESTLYKKSNNYVKQVNDIDRLLHIQIGYFPDDILAMKYIDGSYTVENILSFKKVEETPREKIIKLFVSILLTHESYKNDKELILETSKNIEKSCYNAIISICKDCEDPPCRKWSSPIFLEMYSNRCSIIYNLLDINSSTCKLYGSTLIDQLGSISLDEIGFKSEKELYPQATEKERKEILLRSEQHIIEKESNLFKCPNCKQSRVTYREVQLRAADEPADYICKCLNCKHRFKGH